MSSQAQIKCPLCSFLFNQGDRICQGCKGRIYYGATPYERNEAKKVGAGIGGLIAIAIFFISMQLSIAINFGWFILLGVVLAAVGAFLNWKRVVDKDPSKITVTK
ncbi:MAG TPA: hypothetical protein VFF89_01630 [Sphingobium sp.]|nr:hypothetical protein [Sphingobium sp.]